MEALGPERWGVGEHSTNVLVFIRLQNSPYFMVFCAFKYARNAKLVLRKKPTVLQSRYWFAAVGLNPLPYFNGTKNSKMHSYHVLDNNLSFITPRCLRQRPKCTLFSCFNAIYNFYSFILPSEMIEVYEIIHFWNDRANSHYSHCFCIFDVQLEEFIKQIQVSRADNTLFRIRTDSHEIIYPV